jgi:predicted nucleotidyltransferase
MIIYEDILRAFQKNKVKYVLVGGLAVNLQGAFRSTVDLDILVEMTDTNLAKIVRILKDKKYFVKQPVDPMGISDARTRKDWIENKNMKAFCFFKENGEQVDLIIDSPVKFVDAMKEADIQRVDDIRLPVVSIRHLIKMKEKTGRLKDKLDVHELKRIRKLKGAR